MSSEDCDQVPEEEVQKMRQDRGNADMEVNCDGGRCTVCTQDKVYSCVYEERSSIPCTDRGCAESVQCGVEEEEVCTVRPEALKDLGDSVPRELQPEKVPESKLRRRLTAIVLPALAAVAVVLFAVALFAWGAARVKRARKEAAEQAEVDRLERLKSAEMSLKTEPSVHGPDEPLTHPPPGPRFGTKIRLPLGRLGMGGVDTEEAARASTRRSSRNTPLRWTPRSHYRSVSDFDTDMSTAMDVNGQGEEGRYQVRGNLKRTRSRSVDGDKDQRDDDAGPTEKPSHYRIGSWGFPRIV